MTKVYSSPFRQQSSLNSVVKTTGTLTRLGGLDVPLIVQLTHDQLNRASLPDQVIIPAGQTSVTSRRLPSTTRSTMATLW